MTIIPIIFFNEPEFLIRQYEQLKLHCRDQFMLVVVDTSSDEEASKALKYHAAIRGLQYVRVKTSVSDPSQSHAFAANFISQWIEKYEYDYKMYLDHDCFPVEDFSACQLLEDNVDVAGLPQTRGDKTYFWPGCLVARKGVELDFNVAPGLDTGGMTYKAIEQYNYDVFDEQYVQNPSEPDNRYNFYSLLCDGKFMHFLNGSNWNKTDRHKERLNSLYNLLK